MITIDKELFLLQIVTQAKGKISTARLSPLPWQLILSLPVSNLMKDAPETDAHERY
ncbi:hypothetical protein [Cyanothece sp. BG0011]|uniref:hypothetical protein n=1 Tax=Cyanothece sp. BG0011 TaxID=2082950 RepID=UPI0018E53EC1|nr:hypothetical protein [Cyanothece sp. BG0011]